MAEPKEKKFSSTLVASTGSRRRASLPPDGEVPEKIGKYIIRGEVGRGASGVVYKSRDPFVQREVAVKVARHEGVSGAPEDTEEGKSFFAEARAAGMLQHPNIVSLYDAGVENDLFYLVMEYIDGVTLQPFCHPNGPRPPLEKVVDIIFKCANGLDYSHASGVLHRDIKPTNIMLTSTGVPKIMDFSIAEISTDRSQGFALTGSPLGSPLYMSPEQVRPGGELSPASDLYALGAVMYQMLTGHPPFKANDLHTLFRLIQDQPAPRIEDSRDDVPEALCNIVARLLKKDPEDRPQSGRALAGELVGLFDQLRVQERQQARRDNTNSLRRLRFFDRFSDSEIEEVLAAGTLITHTAGSTIVEEGSIENAFYIVVLGAAEVKKGQRTLHRLERGDCYGEAGFGATVRSTSSVVAATQVMALKVSATRLESRSEGCQLRFYKTFLESMIYRLAMSGARGAAAAAAAAASMAATGGKAL